MESPRRWINRYQPQTLVMGTMLLYLEGFFSLLRGSSVLLVTGLAMFPAGFLVANDKRIGRSASGRRPSASSSGSGWSASRPAS